MRGKTYLGLLASAAFAASSISAVAQEPDDEIIVTARKRQESILQVPVVMTAISDEKLDRLQATEIADLPKLVPGLVLGEQLGTLGTLVAIRGVGTSAYDPGVDQSIALNLDGMSLSNGLAFSSGLFDLAQIEVLKGPQALFYGKGSPGGVISMRTADPTYDVEIVARAGYEFEGREGRGELIVSGPLSETVRGRFAAMYAAGKGYFTNHAVAAGFGAMNPKYGREPRPRNHIVRGTLLWQPSETFEARLKVNLVGHRAINAETSQLSNCPDGADQNFGIPFMGGDDCKMNRELNIVHMDPAAYPGVMNDGVPFIDTNQKFGTLELNTAVGPGLSLTSLTGYYKVRMRGMLNATHATAAGPILVAQNHFSREEFTQEVRLNSEFSGPLDFTLGGFYQDGRIRGRVILIGNTTIGFPPLISDGRSTVDIKTASLFGQLRWRLFPELELAGGVRWTDETRTLSVFNFLTNTGYLPAGNRIHASNLAPEVTLTYTPRDNLTLFAAFKRGYKSGSFGIGVAPTPNQDTSFGDERVTGGEVGLKSRLLDRKVLLNLAAYDYRYKGLQVGAVEPADETGLPVVKTVNAGSARSYGIDFDAAYNPASLKGLSLNASLNWNRGRYRTLNNVPCYAGQTIAQQCNQFLNPSTDLFTAQDLSGTPLIRSPEWQATFGFSYETPINSGWQLVFTNSNQYSSRFVTYLATERPNNDNFQKSFIKTDVSVAIGDTDDRWELALIGKNITDKITSSTCQASNFAGGNLLGGQITGGPTSGPAGYSEAGCNTERGRSVWVRLTLRPRQ